MFFGFSAFFFTSSFAIEFFCFLGYKLSLGFSGGIGVMDRGELYGIVAYLLNEVARAISSFPKLH